MGALRTSSTSRPGWKPRSKRRRHRTECESRYAAMIAVAPFGKSLKAIVEAKGQSRVHTSAREVSSLASDVISG